MNWFTFSPPFVTYCVIAIGGTVGTLLRFWVSTFAGQQFGETFPWGTLFINVSGSFAIGLFAGLTDSSTIWLATPNFRLFFMVGICGGYTTFSSFSLQTLRLAHLGQWPLVFGYIIGTNLGCLVAVWLGYSGALALKKLS